MRSAWPVLAVVLSATLSAAAGQGRAELGPGDVLHFAATPRASYEVRVPVGQGELARIVAESAAADLAIDVLDASGQVTSEIDRWDSLVTRPEEVAWVASASHEARIRVRVLEVAPEVTDDLRLRLAERRAVTPADARRLEIEALERSAALERRTETAESRKAAAEKFERAAAAWHALGDEDREGRALHDAAIMQYYLGRLRESRALYERVLPLRRRHPVADEVAEVLNRLAIVTRATGDPGAALALQEESLQRFRERGNRRGESSVLHNMGSAAFTRGDFDAAIGHFEEAVSLRRPLGAELASESLIGLAASHRNLGDAQSAVRLYGEAIDLKRAAKDREGEARALVNLATAHAVLGDPQRALEVYAQSLAITRVSGATSWQASALAGSGRAALQLGDLTGAAAFGAEALPLAEATGNPGQIGLALTNLGMVRFALQQYGEALALFDRALARFREVGDRVSEAEVLWRRARALGALGRSADAQADAAVSAAVHESLGVASGQATATALMAELALKRGELHAALSLARRAVALHEGVRRRTVDPDMQAGLRSEADNVYQTEIGILMALEAVEPGTGHVEAALLASERGRAESLRRLLVEAQSGLRASLPAELRGREAALRQAIDAKEQGRAALLRAVHTDDARHAIDRDLAALDAQYSGLQAELRQRDPHYAAWSAPPPADVVELARAIGPGAVGLHYSFGIERSVAWLVGRRGVTAVRLAPRDEIERACARLLSLLHHGPKRELRAQLDRAARAVAVLVVDPLIGQLDESRVVLVADGSLQLVPFAMLPDSRNRGEPLLERFEIVGASSLATLALLRRAGPSQAPRTALVVADPVYPIGDARARTAGEGPRVASRTTGADSPRPRTVSNRPTVSDDLRRAAREAGLEALERLPHTGDEAAALSRAGRGLRIDLATGFEATRALLTGARPSEYRVLHLAAHGLVNAQRPTASGLVLSLVDGDGSRLDGYLRLRDIYAMQLDADLVVLSACRTAVGRRVDGEGLVGLTRGFMHAGARGVVASLWDVRDASTARLMGFFYEELLQRGRPPAAALRAAQRRMRRTAGSESPHHWAAFMFQGDPDRSPAAPAQASPAQPHRHR